MADLLGGQFQHSQLVRSGVYKPYNLAVGCIGNELQLYKPILAAFVPYLQVRHSLELRTVLAPKWHQDSLAKYSTPAGLRLGEPLSVVISVIQTHC